MGNYTIAVLVCWAIALWALCSVLFSEPDNFTNLGTSKGRWFLIELTALIPYVGFIAVLFYIFKVRVHFPHAGNHAPHSQRSMQASSSSVSTGLVT